MVKKEIEKFLLERPGYLKKSNIKVAQALWKKSEKNVPKNRTELEKELELIKGVQQAMRVASTIEEDVSEGNVMSIYNAIIEEKQREPIVLFYDLETSPLTTLSWNIGSKISLGTENIIGDRAILCVCYKYSNNDKIYSIEWDKGNDYNLVKKFAEVFNNAQIVCAHNGDSYDSKFLRGRALFHDIDINPKVPSIDTLKMARTTFRLPSNKLDFISKYLGNTGKTPTSFQLWKSIILDHNKEAMKTMVNYCKNDILILEQVYNKLKKYVKPKRR